MAMNTTSFTLLQNFISQEETYLDVPICPKFIERFLTIIKYVICITLIECF